MFPIHRIASPKLRIELPAELAIMPCASFFWPRLTVETVHQGFSLAVFTAPYRLAARGRSTEKSRVVIRCCKATTVPSVGQQREGAARSAKLPSSGPAESAKVGKIP